MNAAELGCGRGLSSSAGYYEGTISFDAKGLTAVDASRAEGSLGLALSTLCDAGIASGEPESPGIYLEAGGGSTDPKLMVSERPHGIAAEIQADISESLGGVVIERTVTVLTSNSSFRHRGLRSATIEPPAPFSGSATFSRGGTANSWRGNLRVNLPGRHGVALTGRGVRASLRRAYRR